MKMQITFPGGAAVDAGFRGFTVRTDQLPKAGGEGSAPAPFDLFLVSLGTCAGYYALRFLQSRNLDTEGLELSLETERDSETKRLAKIHLDLRLPEGFPEKYRAAIVRAMDQCAVKKVLDDPPDFVVRTEVPELATADRVDTDSVFT
jgi:putative redox protein